MTRRSISASGKRSRPHEALPPDPPQRPAPAERPWPYDPDEATMLQWANTALHHYTGIRATGSTPDNGGPSVPLDTPANSASFRYAAQMAERWWPNARSFDVIGSDLEYKANSPKPRDPTKPFTWSAINLDNEGVPPGMSRLRNAIVITTFTVTDRPPVTRPTTTP